jgi:hypothetical protein
LLILIIDNKHLKKRCKDKIGCITTNGNKKPTVSSFEYRPYTDYKKFESCVASIHGTMYIGIHGYVGGSYKLLGGRKSNCVNP